MTTVAFAAATQPTLWRDALRQMPQTTIVDVAPGQESPVAVHAWIIVPSRADDLVSYAFWLKQRTAPIILITPLIAVALRLASTLPKLAYVCHPVRAERDLATVLLLACCWTGGTHVLRAPHVSSSAGRGGLWT